MTTDPQARYVWTSAYCPNCMQTFQVELHLPPGFIFWPMLVCKKCNAELKQSESQEPSDAQ